MSPQAQWRFLLHIQTLGNLPKISSARAMVKKSIIDLFIIHLLHRCTTAAGLHSWLLVFIIDMESFPISFFVLGTCTEEMYS